MRYCRQTTNDEEGRVRFQIISKPSDGSIWERHTMRKIFSWNILVAYWSKWRKITEEELWYTRRVDKNI